MDEIISSNFKFQEFMDPDKLRQNMTPQNVSKSLDWKVMSRDIYS